MFFSDQELEAKSPLKGITRRAAHGEKTMLTIFSFEPKTEIPAHSHPHEQISYVVEGELEFDLDGEIRLLQPGEGVVIRSDVPHSARTLGKGAKVIDCWYPIRDDYR